MRESNLKYWKAVVNLFLAIVTVGIGIWIVPKAVIYFSPFLVGGFIALIASPIVRFLERKFKIKRKASSAIIVMIVIVGVCLGCYIVINRLIVECVGFANALPERIEVLEKDFSVVVGRIQKMYESFPIGVKEALAEIDFKTIGSSVLGSSGEPTIEAVSNFAKQLPTVIVGIVMAILSAYFFVVEKEFLTGMMTKALPPSMSTGYKILKNTLLKAVGGYFKAQFIIELWIYLILVIGLAVLGVEYVLPIALGIALLDFLPIFGTGTVMAPWAIIEFLSADYKMAIGLLVIWGGSQFIRQMIQPKIMGDSIGLPAIPTLFLLYIGYRVGGVVGLIISVPIGMVVYSLYKEGMFHTLEQSIQILVSGINRFRKINAKDMEIVKQDEEENNSL